VQQETKYIGTRTAKGCQIVKVTEGQEPEPLDPRLDLWNHSPSGFELTAQDIERWVSEHRGTVDLSDWEEERDQGL
jgi:hypothetical protein